MEEVAEATEAASRRYNAKRVPSYCDRILFTSLPGAHKFLTQIAYDSAAEITSRCVLCVAYAASVRFPPVRIEGKYRRLKGGLCEEECELREEARDEAALMLL